MDSPYNAFVDKFNEVCDDESYKLDDVYTDEESVSSDGIEYYVGDADE